MQRLWLKMAKSLDMDITSAVMIATLFVTHSPSSDQFSVIRNHTGTLAVNQFQDLEPEQSHTMPTYYMDHHPTSPQTENTNSFLGKNKKSTPFEREHEENIPEILQK